MKIDCLYFDGIHAKEHRYELHIGIGVLSLIDPETHQKKVFWNMDDIKIIQEPTHATPGKLTNIKEPDARLIIPAEGDWSTVIDALPKTVRPKSFVSMKWRAMPLYIILSIACAIIFVKGTPVIMESAVVLIPQAAENKLGDNIVAGFAKDVCEAPEGTSALTKMVTALKQHPRLKDIDLTVTVMEMPIENALAFPGRSIVIFSELIKNAETPEEVAFVLAHETGHIQSRHAMKGYLQSQGVSFLMKIMTGNLSPTSGGFSDIMGTFGNLHNSREHEDESDAFALEVSEYINMDHRDGANFFERMLGEKGSDDTMIPEWLSTHPDTKARIKTIKAFRKGEDVTYMPILTEKEWKALQSICGEPDAEEKDSAT